MHKLSYDNVIRALAEQLEDSFARQVTDPTRPDVGAMISPDMGVDDPGHGCTTPLIVAASYLYTAQAGQFGLAAQRAAYRHAPLPHHLLPRLDLAADYLLRAQRPGGLIDLRSVNYDSSPDTGFAMQALCTAIELGRPVARRDPAYAAALGKIELFVRRAVPGMLTGGFHTPNHRWVIVSALAQAGQLFPDLPVQPVIDAYLAEGIDINSEGTYLERSVGVYDAVCDRSLLLLAQTGDYPQARAAANANLEFDLHLLHADGTAETGLSRRQDYGTHAVPLGLVGPLLMSAYRERNLLFARAAEHLWELGSAHRPDSLTWTAYPLLKFGEPPMSPLTLPDDFARFYPQNGLWRVRRGPLSATFFRDTARLATICYGQAELAALKISMNYFGCGRFISDALTVEGDTATLRSEGTYRPRRPGYDLPLGRPVPPEEWQAALAERDSRPLPPATSELAVTEVAGGFDLHYRTLAGLDRVTVQIVFDFAPGGIWESEDTALKPVAGQVIFLKRGLGRMRYGNDVIEISPGAEAHRIWQMRDAEPAPAHVRVLLGFVTPVDHRFALRVYRGLDK